LNVDRTLGVDASELVGRLHLVRSGVIRLRVLERQGHNVLVHRHGALCARLECLAVLKPSHQQPQIHRQRQLHAVTMSLEESTPSISSSTSFWYHFFHFRLTYSLISPITSSSSDSPLCSSITPSLFQSRLKTYLFHKSYPHSFTPSSRTASTDIWLDRFF